MKSDMQAVRKNVAMIEAEILVRSAALEPVSEPVPLGSALGRVLIAPVVAERDQPPFDASAMDGYAISSTTVPTAGTVFRLVGQSIAGRRFMGKVSLGEAVRIFTGAPIPEGCHRIIIQENIRAGEDEIEILPGHSNEAMHVRSAGQDFARGDVLLSAGMRLDAWRLSLAAAAGASQVNVVKKPRIAVLCTGDELVLPGINPTTDQIYESASFALLALIATWGGEGCYLGIEGDDAEGLQRAMSQVDADLIVTVGGASVGAYDLVKPALQSMGLCLDFASIQVRPGKPTSFGRLSTGVRVLGLPGNPASAFVMAQLLLKPWIEASLGLAKTDIGRLACLSGSLPANGPRESYLRGQIAEARDGLLQVRAFDDQDSSLVRVFSQTNALIRRPANGGPQCEGAQVDIILLERM